MTARVKSELENLYEEAKNKTGLVFEIASFKDAFRTACRLAGIEGLHFHDLRHSCATRLMSNGLSLTEVSLIMGHSNPSMSYRYTNMNQVTQRRAAAIMNQLHLQNERSTSLIESEANAEMVN
jgi:integrase